MGNSFRNNKIHVQKNMCSTCIFRPDNLMHLTEGRVEEMVTESIEAGSAIDCHQTLQGDTAICRGYYDKYGRKVSALRLANAMKIIKTV